MTLATTSPSRAMQKRLQLQPIVADAHDPSEQPMECATAPSLFTVSSLSISFTLSLGDHQSQPSSVSGTLGALSRCIALIFLRRIAWP